MMDKRARALWITAAETAEIREVECPEGPDLLRITAMYSAISRGTERLVFRGQVPPSEFETMRAPFQDGSFAFPVKYGYATVGRIQSGARAGEIVFALHPHQTQFCVPAEAVISVDPSVPPARAVLAANMETALNILWDAGVSAGSRITVVGGGVIGALTAYLCAKFPGTEVCLVDIDPARQTLAQQLGCAFATPESAQDNADVVIHASATSAGLTTALSVAGTEATIVEASWYGNHPTTVPLGAQFHQKRLRIVSSQVGRVPAHMAPRWTHSRRLRKAMDLLADPVLDTLISGETEFDDLPAAYGAILDDPATLCHRVKYPRK